MGLAEQAILDMQAITAGDWGVSISLIAPNGQTATVRGIHTKHFLGVDAEGKEVSDKKASVAFSELNLTAANASYPLRINNEVSITGHRVNVADSTGNVKNYIVRTCLPDEAVGLIVIILNDYE